MLYNAVDRLIVFVKILLFSVLFSTIQRSDVSLSYLRTTARSGTILTNCMIKCNATSTIKIMKFLQSRSHIPTIAVPNSEPDEELAIHEQLAKV